MSLNELNVHFKCPSSDSEDEKSENSYHNRKKSNPDDDNNLDFIIGSELQPIPRPSPKLDIVDRTTDKKNNKFSMWSDILMEEELADTVNQSLKIKDKPVVNKKKRNKKVYVDKDSENYFQWTQKEFDQKFAVKKSNNNKKKKGKAKIILEICRKLKETQTDLITKVFEILGEQKTLKMVAEVLDIEEAGGILTADNQRRRSPGGVLFYLIKKDMTITDEQKKLIFFKQSNNNKKFKNKIKANKRKTSNIDQKSINNNKNNKKRKRNKKKKKSNPTKSKH